MKKKTTDCGASLSDHEATECTNVVIPNPIESIRYFYVTKIGKAFVKKVTKSGRFDQSEVEKLCASGDLRYEIIYRQS